MSKHDYTKHKDEGLYKDIKENLYSVTERYIRDRLETIQPDTNDGKCCVAARYLLQYHSMYWFAIDCTQDFKANFICESQSLFAPMNTAVRAYRNLHCKYGAMIAGLCLYGVLIDDIGSEENGRERACSQGSYSPFIINAIQNITAKEEYIMDVFHLVHRTECVSVGIGHHNSSCAMNDTYCSEKFAILRKTVDRQSNRKECEVHPMPHPAWAQSTCSPVTRMCSMEATLDKGTICPWLSFQCEDGSCINGRFRCDANLDCTDGTDERNCTVPCEYNVSNTTSDGVSMGGQCSNCSYSEGCECSRDHFHCQSGECVSIQGLCDYQADCLDYSDELYCSYPVCRQTHGTDSFDCGDGRCIPASLVCDGQHNCMDGRDEDACSNTIVNTSQYSVSFDYKRLVVRRMMLLHITLSPACRQHQIPCVISKSGVEPVCYDVRNHCVFDQTQTGRIKYCRNGEHLQKCKHAECAGMFKCAESYCIEYFRVCDGRADCIGGQDERSELCLDKHCEGLFLCRQTSVCVSPKHICDNTLHCPHGDDELGCHFVDIACPFGCSCDGNVLICDHFSPFSNLRIPNQIRNIIFSHGESRVVSQLTEKTGLAYNSLSLTNLKLQTLQFLKIPKFQHVVSLDISHNELTYIKQSGLRVLHSLHFLYLQDNQIEILEPVWRVSPLHVLDLRSNALITVDFWEPERQMASEQRPSLIVHTDSVLVCCVFGESCSDPTPKSCGRLLPAVYLSPVVGLIAVVGQTQLIGSSVYQSGKWLTKTFTIVWNLSESLYLSYLFVLVVTDAWYGDAFPHYEEQWVGNGLCQLLRLMSSVSQAVTPVALTIKSVSAVYLCKAGISADFQRSLRAQIGILCVIWVLTILAWLVTFGNDTFISNSPYCMMLDPDYDHYGTVPYMFIASRIISGLALVVCIMCLPMLILTIFHARRSAQRSDVTRTEVETIGLVLFYTSFQIGLFTIDTQLYLMGKSDVEVYLFFALIVYPLSLSLRSCVFVARRLHIECKNKANQPEAQHSEPEK